MSQTIVVAQLLPELNNGGVERGTIEVANYLAENNYISIVISAGGRLLQNLSPNVLHIKLDVGKKSVFAFNLIKPLRKLFKQHKVNIVHARSRLPAWLAYRAIVKLNGPKPCFITTIHGLYSVKRYSSIMAKGDRVISVSKTAQKYVSENYSQYLKKQPTLIYRGIDPIEFPYNYKASSRWLSELSSRFPTLVDSRIVLLPGRLSSLKGAKDLLYWLENSEANCKLVLTSDVTSSEYSKKLNDFFIQKHVANKIIWIGLQSQMKDLYAMADVVVSCSTRPESFGRTVLEALAVGTPVVGYNHGGVGEILDTIFPEGKVELSNSKALSIKINQTLVQAPVVPNNNPFLLTTMLDKTLNVYKDCIKHE